MKSVKKGDKIQVEYEGKFEDGTVFDASEKHEKPLEFKVGSGNVLKAFEEATIGMNEGEEKEITLPPKEAYGDYNPELVKELPRECLSADQQIRVGMYFIMKLQNGHKYPVRIAKIEKEKITIDLNPPLAGKTLIFKIKVVQIAG